MSVTKESEPTTNDFDPIFFDLRDFPGDGVFVRVFTEMLLSYIFWPSVVKYGILSNNRGSKLHVVIDCLFLLFWCLFFFGYSCSKVGWCCPADKSLATGY